MSDKLTVGLAQIAPAWLDRGATLNKVEDYVSRAAGEGAGAGASIDRSS